ncbi:MAG: Cas10/Cmr2 second palm domain-containing protein [Atopobiaceae bacterium]
MLSNDRLRDWNIKPISPAYSDDFSTVFREDDPNDPGGAFLDGVGRWNDHLFFVLDSEKVEEDKLGEAMDGVIASAKRDVAGGVLSALRQTSSNQQAQNPEAQQALSDYIQIAWMSADESQVGDENCILALSKYLDSLELCQGIPTNDEANPLYEFLLGSKDDPDPRPNENVKNCWLVPEGYRDGTLGKSNFPLFTRNGRIRDIEHIAGRARRGIDAQWKRYSYYAVVQADGDNMTKTIQTARTPGETLEFSAKCLAYSGEASRLIDLYGGMTIYAGGDDLLFLAPLEGSCPDGGTMSILGLCSRIQAAFQRIFGKGQPNSPLAVSFGISVAYYKSPLYESLRSAQYLLFACSKRNSYGKRRITLSLQKHSGQSVCFSVASEAQLEDGSPSPLALLDTLICSALPRGRPLGCGQADAAPLGEETDDELRSVLYRLGEFEGLFESAMRMEHDGVAGTRVSDLYDNMFDAADQKRFAGYLSGIQSLGQAIVASDTKDKAGNRSCWSLAEGLPSGQAGTPGGNGNAYYETQGYVNALCSMLRFAKLYSERGEE